MQRNNKVNRIIETETLIVGASAAGLAVAACLKQRDQPFTLIEQSGRVADSWRRHYDRLHLHTSRGLSGLPGHPMPRHYPKYPSRDQVVAYLEQYAAHFELEPIYYQRLVQAERVDGRWRSTTEDRSYVSDNLVLATGYARRPNVPEWPGRADFAGPIIHSSQYRNGQPFAGQAVLVVGFGNSGGEIAVDLFEHGARPAIVVRSPVNIVARDTLGISSVSWNLVLSRLPGNLGDWVAAPLVRASVGDLTPYGVRKSRIGPIEQIKALEQIPLIDVGTVKLIKQGHLPVYPAIERFTHNGVIFVDGREAAFDAVVLATGYRPDLDEFIPDAAETVAQDGVPVARGRALSRPGLYMCGFNVSRTGMLREIGIEARRIAAMISHNRGD
ncbi:MAG: NAD(P)/FAD-dependent oxidoreductase [Candidatus Promineofilum sp.]|nr:NAD(P)/FAD-dependent oxidoreductase [Promineifilum sp.]